MRPALQPGSEAVLAKAVRRVAAILALSQAELANVLGTSAATASRTISRARGIEPRSAEGRHALLLVRVFRSLDTLVGGDGEKARSWLRAPNAHLGNTPLLLLANTEGLVLVGQYLDAMRGTL